MKLCKFHFCECDSWYWLDPGSVVNLFATRDTVGGMMKDLVLCLGWTLTSSTMWVYYVAHLAAAPDMWVTTYPSSLRLHIALD